MEEDLAQTVRRLADRQAILDCLTTYSRGVDRLDRELLLSAYHPDAVDDHSTFVGGREAFADWVFAYHGTAQSSTQHIITNHSCELDGDVAHTETYFMFASMNNQGPELSFRGGRYVDRFEKRDGRWAIAARKCITDWSGTPGDLLISEERRKMINSCGKPTRDRSDPSYERPLTIAPERLLQKAAQG